MSAPLHTVKNQFGSKKAFVSQLMPLLDRQQGESEAEFEDRLMRVSNRILLRLWDRAQTLRDGFGNRESLVDAIIENQGLPQSARAKLNGRSTGTLLNMGSGLGKTAK